MLEQIKKALQEAHVTPGDGIVAGVSGGMDSMALIVALHDLGMNSLFAAHLNHGIRGDEADADAAFVRASMAERSIPYFEKKMDVPKIAQREGKGMEEAAREARYAFFEEVRRKIGAKWIATAHHQEDQAETVLLHMLRGTGPRGLSGMALKAGQLIRPMLPVKKADVEQFVSDREIAFRTDSTNLDPSMTRNRIRLELLPQLKMQYNPNVSQCLARTATLCREDEEYLLSLSLEGVLAAQTQGGGYDCRTLLALPGPLRSRAVMEILDRSGALYDMEYSGLVRVISLLSARHGARAPLPKGNWARVEYGRLYIDVGRLAEQADWLVELAVPGNSRVPGGEFQVSYAQERREEGAFVAFLDADSLPGGLHARSRRPGDRFHPYGAPGTKKLKDYWIDHKIPMERRQLPILTAGEEIVFVPGCTIAHFARVRHDTKHILRIQYKSADELGGS